jgi:hypothetical protein
VREAVATARERTGCFFEVLAMGALCPAGGAVDMAGTPEILRNSVFFGGRGGHRREAA